MAKNLLFAVSIIVGMTIGAGIFGLPYVVSKSGIIPALFYFLILGGVTLLLNLLFGEIILRTKDTHRLVGYAEKYIGRWGKSLITISSFLGGGTLLAYIILAGDFLNILITPWTAIGSFYLGLIFWLVLSLLIFIGIKIVAPLELFSNAAFLIIVVAIFLFAIPQISLQNFILYNASNLILPYGVILFAFSGLAAIPEVGEILKTDEELLSYKKAIILSFIIIFLIYLLFSAAIVGISGKGTTQDALAGLTKIFGFKIIFIGLLAAVITIADSFLIIGIYLKNILVYDYKLSKPLASFIVTALPLVFYLAGLRSFISLVGLLGALVVAVESIAVILIFQKAKKMGDRTPEYSLTVPSPLLYGLTSLLIAGAIIYIFYYYI